MLRNFDPKLPTVISVDASPNGIGACLTQKHEDGWYPTQFSSRKLNKSEQGYSHIEKEALSVVFGCEKFKNFVLGSKFVVQSDHNPLKKLFGSTSPLPDLVSASIKCWALRLSQFDFSIEYIKGIDNKNADFLSRFPVDESPKINEPYEMIFNIRSINKLPISCHDIKKVIDDDPILSQFKTDIINGTLPKVLNAELKEFSNIINEISIVHGCLMFRDRVFIPKALRSQVLDCFHLNHPGQSAMKSLVRPLIYYPGLDKDVELICKSCKICQNMQNKPPQNNNVEWPVPEKKFSRIHVGCRPFFLWW